MCSWAEQKPQQKSGSLPDPRVGCWQGGCEMLTGMEPILCPVGRAGQTPAPARLDMRCSGGCTALPMPSPLLPRKTRNKHGCSSSPPEHPPPARASHSRVPFQWCQPCREQQERRNSQSPPPAPQDRLWQLFPIEPGKALHEKNRGTKGRRKSKFPR